MAKAAKKRKAARGRMVDVPRKARGKIKTALRAVRGAKANIPPGKHRKAWSLLHRIESELVRSSK